MSLPSVEKAVLIPFQRDSDQPNTEETITLDFNPATLSIEVTNSLEEGNGSQARQTVKETVSNLSFDAIFDSTHTSIEVDSPEELDVRRRTQKLVGLLGRGADDENGGGNSTRVPARVRFKWGTIIFDGVFSSYSETLDYFSPDGIPLRARVSIQLTEQEYQYRVEDHAGLAGLGRNEGGASDGGQSATAEDPQNEDDDSWSVADAANGLGGLGGAFGAGLSAGFSGEFGLGVEAGIEAGIGIGASVGVSGSFGISAGIDAQFGLGASVSTGVALEGSVNLGVDVAAELGGDVDLGVAAAVYGEGLFDGEGSRDLHPAVEASSQVQQSARAPGQPATVSLPWAEAAPAPGSLAARVAADVARGRASTTARPGQQRAPLAGAPPTVLPAIGPPARSVFTPYAPESGPRVGLTPSWEIEPPPSSEVATNCCQRCGGAQPKPGDVPRKSPRKPSKRCRCAD